MSSSSCWGLNHETRERPCLPATPSLGIRDVECLLFNCPSRRMTLPLSVPYPTAKSAPRLEIDGFAHRAPWKSKSQAVHWTSASVEDNGHGRQPPNACTLTRNTNRLGERGSRRTRARRGAGSENVAGCCAASNPHHQHSGDLVERFAIPWNACGMFANQCNSKLR